MNNITSEFALDSIDHDELLHFLSQQYVTAWRTKSASRRSPITEIALPASEQFALLLQYKHGRITKVLRGPLLRKKQDLETLLEAIRVNCRDPTIKEYGRGFLTASVPVCGGYQSPAVPLQILPPTDDLPRPGFIHGQHLFFIEFPIRSWQRQDMRNWRRYKCLTEWAWVLNALLYTNVRVEGPRPSSAWVFNPAAQTYLFAQKQYPLLPGVGLIRELSPNGNALAVVSAHIYYADWNVRAHANLPQDELILPDDLDHSLAMFNALTGEKRQRFLSAAATIYMSSSVWDMSISMSFIASIQAIECVAQELPRWSSSWIFWRRRIGPTRRFYKICEAHGAAAGIDARTLQQLYDIRSSIVHGESAFEIDRHPWGLGMAGAVLGLDDVDAAGAATRLAKCVLRDWLHRQ